MRPLLNHNRIFWYCALAIAFFLPVFGRVVPLLILVMVLNWLINGQIWQNGHKLLKEKQRYQTLFFASVYVLYLIGLTYTSNFDYAWFDLEVKLSLLIFPLILATAPRPLLTRTQYEKVFAAFIGGCVAGAAILTSHAAFMEFSGNTPGSFYYTSLAWYFHPSYLAMYYNFAVGMLLLHRIHTPEMPRREKVILDVITLFLSWMIMLLASKAGLITLAVILILTVITGAVFRKRKKMSVLILISGVVIFAAGYFLAPVAFSRMASAEKAVTAVNDPARAKAESNADRMIVWKSAIRVIGENYLFGVGTGDVKDALVEKYTGQHSLPAMKHKYNAHSQFLQTFITLGIPGLLLLLMLLAWPAWQALKDHRFVYFFFLLIFSLNMMTESMLEVQAGVIFYAFFNILLFTKPERLPDQ